MDRNPIHIASGFSRFGEVVAGSNEEMRIVEEVLRVVEGEADDVRMEWVPVTSWREELCLVEVGGAKVECSTHPPTPSCDVEGRAVVVDLEHVFSRRVEVEDRVAVVMGVEDPDDVAEASSILRSMGALGVVFVDKHDVLRRIVVCEDPVPRYGSSKPLPIPVVHVRRGAARFLSEGVVLRIVTETRSKRSYGVNVVADFHGSRESIVYVSAHHDHWFHGFVDDLLGVGVALEIARRARKRVRKSIRLAMFTAEEGLPEVMTPLYWAVGSRHHVLNAWAREGDRMEFVVNVDVPYGEVIAAVSGLEALGVANYLELDTDTYSFIYDTLPFTMLGVPTATLQNFGAFLSSGLYHSDADVFDPSLALSAERYVETGLRIVMAIDRFGAERFAELGLLEASKQLLNRGALPSIVMRGVERCIQRLSVRRDVVRPINALVFGYALTRHFLTKPGVREVGGVVPWSPGTVEIPSGVSIDGWRRAFEKALSILNSISYICRGS